MPTFISTHPDPENRYNKVNKEATFWQDSLKHAGWKVNTNSYLRLIDGLVYGEDPLQGYVQNNIFYHPKMKFKYPVPPGWQLQNSPLQVQMAPKDGKAMMIFMMAKQKTLDEAVQQTFRQLKLTVLNSKHRTINGMPAIGTIAQQVSQNQQSGQQQVVKVMSYFIEYNGAIYVFHGVANEPDFNSYSQTFESTMLNFSRLTEPSKLNVRPKRIKIKPVRRSGTFANVLKYYGVPQAQQKELALLNGLELTDKVPAGKLIKLIGVSTNPFNLIVA